MAWDEDKKAKAVELYEKAEPTPENSIEIVKEIAEELEETPNGVRMILSKAGVYIKKDGASSTKAEGTTKKATTGAAKVSKADSLQALKDIIEAIGQEADADIIDKLTGKQAVYFTEMIKAAQSAE
jgi:hypothetical protein